MRTFLYRVECCLMISAGADKGRNGRFRKALVDHFIRLTESKPINIDDLDWCEAPVCAADEPQGWPDRSYLIDEAGYGPGDPSIPSDWNWKK
jgi:hypothetical protein